jgi:DNA-binding transcriptional LysR family regulator
MNLGVIDNALLERSQKRNVVASVDGFSTALALSRGTDLIATVPEHHTTGLRTGMYSFPVPLPDYKFTISLLWHPRLDGDPAHRWLRDCIRNTCRTEVALSEDTDSPDVAIRT